MAKTPSRAPALWIVEIDGQAGVALDSFTPPTHELQEVVQGRGATRRTFGSPTTGSAVATLPISASGPFTDWVDAFVNGKIRPAQIVVTLADSGFTARLRLELADCLITGVSFPPLDAAATKEAIGITVTLQAAALLYPKAGGKIAAPLQSKRKAWLASSFRLTAPGFDGTRVSRIDLPAISLTLPPGTGGTGRVPGQLGSWAIGGLTTEHVPGQYDVLLSFAKAVEDGTISGSEYADLTVDLLDASGKALATFALEECAPKKVAWTEEPGGAPAVRLEFAPARLTFERKEPAPAAMSRAARTRPTPATRRGR